MNISAIPTKYNGYKYRSKMEAKTAVFLDSLKISFEYEKEGYKLILPFSSPNEERDEIFYLPDFYIPAQDCIDECFIEVKGVTPSYDENEKAIALCLATKIPVIFVYGFPDMEKTFDHINGYIPSNEDGKYFDFDDVFKNNVPLFFLKRDNKIVFQQFDENKAIFDDDNLHYTNLFDDKYYEDVSLAYSEARYAFSPK